MSLESIINVAITGSARGVSRKGFGMPLVVGFHTAWLEKFRIYNLATALADMVTDGISATGPIYRAVQGLASNSPKPNQVTIGRLGTTFTHKGTITVKAGTVETGKVYSIQATSPAGAVTLASYTALGTDTPSLIAAALGAQLALITGLGATVTGPAIDWLADNTGEAWRFSLSAQLFEFADTTVDTGLAADISAITQLAPDWYGLILADAPSKARILACAALVETMERIFGTVTHNTDDLDSSATTSTCAALKASQYFRTFCIYSADQNAHAAATWMGNRFPFDPGSQTWAYKPLSGVVVDALTATQEAGLAVKNANSYVTVAGVPVTVDGRMASAEWIDVVRGRDWLVARMRERLFSLLVNNKKIPFTNPGIQLVTSQVEAQLAEGITANYLAASPAPIVTAPAAEDVSDADKIERTLPNVYFEATLAGAIHKIRLNGVLKV